MTELKCVLDIMTEKGYIEVKHSRQNNGINEYYIHITSEIKDINIKKEMYKKIYDKIKNDNQFLVNSSGPVNPMYCKKEEIHKFIEKFIDSGKEIFQTEYIQEYIRDFIESCYPGIAVDVWGCEITNLDVKRERITKQQRKDKEALELLNNIL